MILINQEKNNLNKQTQYINSEYPSVRQASTGSVCRLCSSVVPSRYSRKRSHAAVELHDGKRRAMTKTNPRGCVFCMVEDRRKYADAPLCIIRRYVQCHALRRTLFSNKTFYILSSPWLHNGIEISYSLDTPPPFLPCPYLSVSLEVSNCQIQCNFGNRSNVLVQLTAVPERRRVKCGCT